MTRRRPTILKTPIVAMILVSFVVSGIFGVAPFIGTSPAAAQVVSAPGVEAVGALNASQTTVQTAPTVNTSGQATAQTGLSTSAKVLRALEKAVVPVVLIAVANAMDYFAKKLAYDAATALATAGTGQKPLFVTDPGGYFKSVALDAAGEALGSLSGPDGFGKLGIDLCSPRLPKINLNIKLGFINDLKKLQGGPVSSRQPEPKCSWKSIEGNWTEFSKMKSEDVLNQAGVMFSPGESGVETALEFNRYSMNLMEKRVHDEQGKYVANAGFKDLTTKITGKTKTPADSIRAHMNQTQARSGDKPAQETSNYAKGIKEAGLTILANMVKTFANTLIEKLSNRLFDGGLFTLGQLAGGGKDHDFLLETEAAPEGQDREAAELANKDLLTPRTLTVSNYDQLVEFSVCPSEGRTMSNCVMDTQFFAAINRADQDAPLTVKQAIEQGLISGNWRLLPLVHPNNRSATCYLNSYCYSNLAKMRRARVLPIGWELAANSPFNNVNAPVTVKEVMERFNDCPVDDEGNIDVSKLPDPLHPWCRLIDPNWVLKYPKEICKLEAFGPNILSPQSSVRGKVCVDSTSCIFTDSEGNCAGGYGYCTREKSYWKFAADSCPAEFASCQAFRQGKGGGSTVGYLTNTTDSNICSSENAGCLRYSTIKSALPNGGFEDVLGSAASPRGWSLSGGAVLDRSGTKGFRGLNAIGLPAGASVSATAVTLPASKYKLSISAAAEDPSASYDVEMRLIFKDRAGAVIDDPNLATDCNLIAGGVSFRVAISSLGHTTYGCEVTTPSGAIKGDVSISAIAPPAGNIAWVDEVGINGTSYSADLLDGIYLKGKAEVCSEDGVGCTELIRASSNSLNLVRNPGFEKVETGVTTPQFWTVPSGGYDTGTGASHEGASAVVLSSSSVTQDVKGLLPDASYVFSVFTRQDGAGTVPSGTARLEFHKGNGASSGFADCDPAAGADALKLAVATGYERATCQFNAPSDIGFVRIIMRKDSGSSRLLADAAQLEIAVVASAYHEDYGPVDKLRMKKAPPGLSCAGVSTDPAECSGFAKSCRREDVGCNLYTPAQGGASIPASVGASDYCPVTCVGYETFKEEASNFKDASFPVYLIPKTGKSCPANDSGCEEFTNLERLAQGGEAKEYLSYVRYCQQPDDQVGTFYTWEGNDERGYQLRVWTLRKSDLHIDPTADSGSDPTGAEASTSASPSDAAAPCTVLRYDEATGRPLCGDTPAKIAACSKANVRANPDCREFYDVEGNIHYRLYSRTIVSTDDCTDLRMTRVAGATEAERRTSCEEHGGLWTRNECHYFGLMGESSRCPAASDSCRAYAGNASRNVRLVLEDGFESGTTDGWEPLAASAPGSVVNSNESVSAGGHSLKVNFDEAAKGVTRDVHDKEQYKLTFWAKGGGDLTVSFLTTTADPQALSTVALTTDWKIYTAGPVTLSKGNDDEVHLSFTNPGGGPARPFYVDNVTLSAADENVYLIKDSWRTPAECDRTPAGSVAPQYMLGCQAYTDRKNTKVFLKSFDRLCREEVAGCEAFYDTKNSLSAFPETFRAVCSLADDRNLPADAGTSPDVCKQSGGALTCPCEVGGRTVCQVVAGFTTCRYDTVDDAGNQLSSVDPVDGHISPEGDTVRVPADELIYLIDDSRFYCEEQAVGCTAMGKRTLNPDGDVITAWSTVYLKNNPRIYADILCSEDEEFCQEYTRLEDHTPAYFKEPGNHACEFKTGVTIAGFSYNGWFKKGTPEPCYPDFLRAGNFYDMWRNSDSLYEGWAGECPQNFSRCKELIDPIDVSNQYPYGQPYYAIANDRLDLKSCEGRVSRTTAPSAARDASACALFRQSDSVTLPFSAQPSYDASEEDFGGLVPAVNADAIVHASDPPVCDAAAASPTSCCGNGFIEKAADESWKEECDRGLLNGLLGINCDTRCRALNDSNVVIRVKRDRQCAQWLDCRTSETVFNAADGAFTNVCTGFGLCGEYQKVGDSTRCVRFIDNEITGKVLSTKEYQGRNIHWDGLEYSGLSVPNRYPLEELKTIDTDSNSRGQSNALLKTPDPRLVYSLGKADCGSYGDPCGEVNNLGNQGTCLGIPGAIECVYPIDGSAAIGDPGQLKQVQGLLSYPAASCRAYPQESAPFPSSVADPGGWDLTASEINGGNPRFISASQNFDGANVCQRRLINGTEIGGCECSYQVASYGTFVKKYLSIADGDLPSGYCEGGIYDAYECDPLAAGLRTRRNLSCCSKIIPPEKGDTIAGGLSVDCEQGGECKPLSKVEHVIGYEGQCVERDFTWPINGRADEFACLTWRPVGLVGGTRDIYNLYKSAGYFTPIDRRYYCLDTQTQWSITLTVSTSPPSVSPPVPIIANPNQPFLKFFKPGRVTNMELTFASGDNDCEDSDRDIGGEWCLFPGVSKQNDIFQKNSEGGTVMCPDKTGCGGGYSCRCSESGKSVDACDSTDRVCKSSSGAFYQEAPAYNILGCYEVSDESSAEKASITWDYIGPPIYRDQLAYIWFGMVNQVSSSVRAVTNNNQNTHGNCNDEHDDSLVDSDCTSSSCTNDVYRNGALSHDHILNEESKWKKNMASRGGDVLFEASFDTRNQLSRLKLTATDANDEGTFGIERMGFHFKEGCKNVVRVDKPGQFGLTTALTDAVNPYRNFERKSSTTTFTDDSPVNRTSFVQACRAWGAIGGITRNPTNGPGSGETTNPPWGYVVKHPKQKTTDKAPDNDPTKEAQVDQCTLNSFHSGSDYDIVQTNPNALQRLFRAAFNRYQFKTYTPSDVDPGGALNTTIYNDITPSSGNAWDLTGSTSYDPTKISPPRVASVDVDKCDIGGCVAKELDKITVGNKDSGIITVPGGVFAATVRFFGWASHNAMPVNSRTVDWSDSFATEPPAKGWYKNQKPFCSADTSDFGAARECAGSAGLTCRSNGDCPGGASCADVGNHFGNTPGACATGSFQFDHTYTCTTRDLERLTNGCSFDSRNRATNAPCREDFGTSTNPQWTCVYRPAVQVSDNWGWCNCTGSGCRIPDRGAFGAECAPRASATGSARPWTYFDGEIRVQAGEVDNLTFRETGGTCDFICRFRAVQRVFINAGI